MDAARNTLLGEIAADAALERSDFLRVGAEQLDRFLDANRGRIRELGGMVLIDDEPDYLSVAPDGTFRSRSRFEDEVTGEWMSETEVIESAAELVELYNPAEIYAAFAEAAREEAGMPEEPTAADDLLDTAGVATEETVLGDDVYAQAADDWAAARGAEETPASDEAAARRLYDLALTFQERSQHSEARLIEQFESAAVAPMARLGDLMVVDDEDERLTLRGDGSFTAEVVPEGDESTWRRLDSPDEIVEFYDPTDVFGDLAEAVAEAWPSAAGDYGEEGAEEGADGDKAEGDEVEGDQDDMEAEAEARGAETRTETDAEPSVSDGRDRLPSEDEERR
jgi:hypothetical protein